MICNFVWHQSPQDSREQPSWPPFCVQNFVAENQWKRQSSNLWPGYTRLTPKGDPLFVVHTTSNTQMKLAAHLNGSILHSQWPHFDLVTANWQNMSLTATGSFCEICFNWRSYFITSHVHKSVSKNDLLDSVKRQRSATRKGNDLFTDNEDNHAACHLCGHSLSVAVSVSMKTVLSI